MNKLIPSFLIVSSILLNKHAKAEKININPSIKQDETNNLNINIYGIDKDNLDIKREGNNLDITGKDPKNYIITTN